MPRRMKIRVKGYRKPSIRKRVKGYTYLRKDVGAPGRTPKAKRWFEPKRETGWRKNLPPATRRARLMVATDKRLSLRARRVQAGRMAQALANVTVDRETKRKAQSDANYFFGLVG